MHTVVAIVTLLAWSLWFGGSIAMFLFVQALFQNNRAIAIEAAPMIFRAFALYQIVLAATALIGAGVWRLTTRRAILSSLFWLLALASVGCVVTGAIITPQMERMRMQGQSSSPEFRKMHGVSMVVYLSQTAVLLIAGLTLPAAMRCGSDADATQPSALSS